MKKIYLDIDGVILTTHNTKIATGAIPFLNYILEHYDCYWLTTHCRDGNTGWLLNMLAHFFPSRILEKMKQIKPTKWDTLKTEAIDFNSDFYWIDDYVFNAEIEVLKSKSCLSKLLLVDLRNINELNRIKDVISIM